MKPWIKIKMGPALYPHQNSMSKKILRECNLWHKDPYIVLIRLETMYHADKGRGSELFEDFFTVSKDWIVVGLIVLECLLGQFVYSTVDKSLLIHLLPKIIL